MNVDTCFGLELFKIKKMIDFFTEQGYDPNDWDKFEAELKLLKLR